MSNYNQQENREQHASDQFGQQMANEAEQDFSYVEQKKPLNRNFVVLLLIAVVGASLVYLMYVRGRFNADTQIPELTAANNEVSQKIAEATLNLQTIESQLAKTETNVKAFQASNASGQIAADQLKTNPFTFPEARTNDTAAPPPVVANPIDPRGGVEGALARMKVQMILYSNTGSTAQINTGIYRKGDHVTADQVTFTVVDITRDEVVLRHNGEEFRVHVAGKQGL